MSVTSPSRATYPTHFMVMDKTMVEKHLALARRHVAEGERHIVRQRQIILDLEDGGHNTVEANRLLVIFEDLQRLHVADRDRLEQELLAFG